MTVRKIYIYIYIFINTLSVCTCLTSFLVLIMQVKLAAFTLRLYSERFGAAIPQTDGIHRAEKDET